jgi:hypothetical protein
MSQSGIDWIKSNREPRLCKFGEKVADILDEVFAGIYHIDRAVMKPGVQWDSDRLIEIVIGYGLSTFDSNKLTHLVVMAHAHCVRLEISAATHGYLRLSFSSRSLSGSIMDRHPTLADHIESISKHSRSVVFKD